MPGPAGVRGLGPGWGRSLFVLGFLMVAVGIVASPVGADEMAPTPLAEANGDGISAEERERALGAKLRKLEEQVYDLKRSQLDTLIAERLLAQEAAKRATSVPALLDVEVTAKVGLVTEQEVETFYQANKD